MRMKKYFAPLFLAALLSASVSFPAMADYETPVNLTASASTFSVTVPTSIAITVNADGSVTCPDSSAVQISNSSAGPVKVTNIRMNNGTWGLVSYNGGNRSGVAAAGVDSNKLGFKLEANGDTAATSKDGSQDLSHTESKWVINGGSALSITTSAIASAVSQSTSQAETAATLIFTIAWNAAN